MAFFVQLLANYAGLIYVACVIGAVLYIREIITARQDLRHALYSMEREAANSRLVRSVFMICLFLAISLGTYVLVAYVAPNLPAEAPNSTPTVPFILTSATPTPTFQPSPTRTPRPTLTPTGAAALTQPAQPTAVQQATPTPAAALMWPISTTRRATFNRSSRTTTMIAGSTFAAEASTAMGR